ncbi:TIGR03915 family putative DNA repair protein [Halopseudomonas nanhaiensis]|uniref:TIGR03915 family putative DNA repair protein n=1 Tax=Halopseudomonas nanhaiensis TaxID=2830842 RepID=UPI001CC0B1C4|nr:TIGR03915 family putative DNA repair protein [Halopseudomonas nanhaiensis]UAW98489.1 TIGR03915 family putative DNA repair protein [Halopseudomonas nanhaiensis]
MRVLTCDDDFTQWRSQARGLLLAGVAPEQVCWEDVEARQLFDDQPSDGTLPVVSSGPSVRVPADLLQDLQLAGCHRMPGRWNLLYRVLWRVTHGEPEARLAGDPDGSELQRRIKAVRREAHHLHAFLRFHPCPVNPSLDYVAIHEAAHDILGWASEHFIGRLGRQRWMIVSSRDAVWFDGEHLQHQRSCPEQWRALADAVCSQDDALWQTYYSCIFNPARVNPKVMRGHMPNRFWSGLPEGKLIAGLVGEARLGARQVGQAGRVSAQGGKRIGAKPPASD